MASALQVWTVNADGFPLAGLTPDAEESAVGKVWQACLVLAAYSPGESSSESALTIITRAFGLIGYPLPTRALTACSFAAESPGVLSVASWRLLPES